VTERLHFIGVSTAGSSIVSLFPRWTEILGLDATLVGRDLALRAEPAAFRGVVAEVAEDDGVRGALVTTHKVDVYEHARELFDTLDENARLCREISCISKRDGRLFGHAKDPITAGLSLDAMLPRDYFRTTHAHVLCLGAGGAGTAITVCLVGHEHPPERIAVTDPDEERLDALRELHGQRVEYHPASATDALLASLPAGSLVVNATGMGKDLPGSPLSAEAVFPERAVVWELNYRGELDFLRQAHAQADRGLAIHDGWHYFLRGWTEVIAEVFEVDLTPDLFARLSEAAEPFRARQPA
jgi:shikimate 5-dehydrogenase